MVANAFVTKLMGFGPLREDDREWLERVSTNPKKVERDVDLINEGDVPDHLMVILDGFAYRYKVIPEGRRQIFAYLVPGDFCDLHVALLRSMDHSIATLSSCHIVYIPKRIINEMTEERPSLTKAFWWCTLVDEAVLREWLVNVGQRGADRRIAHLFCELHVRLHAVGWTAEGSFDLPITQTELADTVGLSNVHVNRSLKTLREAGLVTFRENIVHIPDVVRLKAYANFTPNYLHLANGGQS
ncbi:Crp/Fnr family transcriptional regulator [Mesorhizobium captivum]|uniref:Crp/Fnr family transcriptional regulator n=1 Tax=Mesorhizobium captivum TaxID=3072319 RepID=UPI002A246660|nr:Crp/Fnr family transcriptional regulator [Mesorhizobium sp. VK3C]MDX8450166.1 Crp/Fnr family transcriptional regulator [Mesorhizobium sp. VK3C]